MSFYVADAPVSDPKHDRFNRWPFAKRIADTIASRTDPSSLVIAIYGAWGDGKTTVLNFVEGELRKLQGTVVIKFNPWRFPDENSLLRGFFGTLAKALNVSLTTGKEEIGKALSKYGGLLDAVWSGVGDATKEAGEILSGIDLETEKRRVAEVLSANGKKVIILMDDIDRLEKSEIQATFKLVKLTADFDNTVYVLAFDAEMVASAIGEQFTSVEGNRLQAGQSFLEKIVQVPLDLPAAPSDALRKFCFNAIDEALRTADIQLSQPEVNNFVRQFCDGLECRLHTPRMAKRYANAITFALAINKGEVNPVDLMLLEGIRVFYPNAYGVIKRSKEELLSVRSAFDEVKKREERRIRVQNSITKDLPKDEADSLWSLTNSLFPRSGTTGFGSDWDEEWAKSQRVASPHYFDRYFTYAVPETDIADAKIAGLLSKVATSSFEDNVASLEAVVRPANAGTVVAKLRGKASQLSPETASNLITAIARSGHLFPDPETLFNFTEPFAQAGILVSNLLRQVPRANRWFVAEAAIDVAQPLRFALEMVKWVSSGKDTKEEDRRLTEEEDVRLWQRLSDRIRKEMMAAKESLILTAPKDAARFLSVWSAHGGEQDVKRYVTSVFEQAPEAAAKLMSGLVGTCYGASGSRPGDFDRNTYDAVAHLVEPTTIHDVLTKMLGDEIAAPVYHGASDRPTELTIAHQFEYVHKAVVNEAQGAEQQSGSEPASGKLETHET